MQGAHLTVLLENIVSKKFESESFAYRIGGQPLPGKLNLGDNGESKREDDFMSEINYIRLRICLTFQGLVRQ
jgi:hypothetical protein